MTRSTDTTTFAGFRPETFRFFKDLGAHNNREWFASRKVLFEQTCREPLKRLTVALDPPFGSDRITRIYRDVRFSKDKSPYRTHISTVVNGSYLQISAEGLYVATGLYLPEPPVLRRLRTAIADDRSGRALAGIIATLRRKGYEVDSHESVASAPRGFDVDHPRIEYLRWKDIYAGRQLAPSEVSTAACVTRIRRVIGDMAPLRAWLGAHVREPARR